MKTKTNSRKPARLKTAKRKGSSAPCRGSTAYAVEWKTKKAKWERIPGQRDNKSQALEYARWFFRDLLVPPEIRCVEIKHSERVL